MEIKRFLWSARDCYGSCSRCEGLRTLPMEKRHFEHTLEWTGHQLALCFATPRSLPATQGERWAHIKAHCTLTASLSERLNPA
jgi:hypothetical protein